MSARNDDNFKPVIVKFETFIIAIISQKKKYAYRDFAFPSSVCRRNTEVHFLRHKVLVWIIFKRT